MPGRDPGTLLPCQCSCLLASCSTDGRDSSQGSHRKYPLLEHIYPDWGEDKVNKAYHGIKNFDPAWTKELVYLEMQPGDTVFFHPLLIHGSGACCNAYIAVMLRSPQSQCQGPTVLCSVSHSRLQPHHRLPQGDQLPLRVVFM